MMRPIATLALLALTALAALHTHKAWAARLVFEETVIEGEVRKPEVTVFISQENLNEKYALQLRESFLPKIVESVSTAPF